MSSGLRSRSTLTGTIRDYIMENSRPEHVRDEVVVENGETDPSNQGAEVTYQSLLSGLPSDPAQLQALLLQSMLSNQTQQRENQQIQKQNQELLAQLEKNLTKPTARKMTNCP